MEPIIQFNNVTWAWWNPDAPEDHSQRTLEDLNIIWDGLDLDIPAGVTSILGENGIGKSTLLLLAGGRLVPQQGQVLLLGTDTRSFAQARDEATVEDQRNQLASYLYQNMELETPLSLGAVLEATAANGLWSRRSPSGSRNRAEALLDELPGAMDLGQVLDRKLQELAKGELQRALMALALCYGSPVIIMDEPCFAMEERHKTACFEYLNQFCSESGTSLVFSAHDIPLCRDQARHMILINKDKSMVTGPAAEVCTREHLEAAYQAPLDTLYRKQHLYRDMLLKGRRASGGDQA